MLKLGWMSEETFESIIPMLQKQGYSLYSKEKNQYGLVRVNMRIEESRSDVTDTLVTLFHSFNPKNHIL